METEHKIEEIIGYEISDIIHQPTKEDSEILDEIVKYLKKLSIYKSNNYFDASKN